MIKRLLQSHMIRQSAILWIGMMAANLSNYLFHLLMGRFLGPINYGVLASLVSILYIIMVPTLTIQTVLAKFTAEFEASEDFSGLYGILRRMTKNLLLVGAALFALFVLASQWMSNFLHFESVVPLILLSLIFWIVYVLAVNRGIMQGLQDFFQLSLNFSLEAGLKLAVGITLVYLGFAVNGAMIGIVVGMFLAYAVSFIPLRSLFREHEAGEVQLGRVFRYSIPVFIVLLCLTGYYSVDIILVKHFMSGVEAGLYSGLAILGKIVVFASLAIVGVMFPVVAGRYERDEEHRHYLAYALGLVGAVSGAVVLAYFVAPTFVIGTLFGAKYVPTAPYLGVFGLAMLLLSLSGVFAYYYLAVHRLAFVYFMAGVALLQIVLISLFHVSIGQVVLIMILTMSLLLSGLALYYFLGSVRRPRGPIVETPK